MQFARFEVFVLLSINKRLSSSVYSTPWHYNVMVVWVGFHNKTTQEALMFGRYSFREKPEGQ